MHRFIAGLRVGVVSEVVWTQRRHRLGHLLLVLLEYFSGFISNVMIHLNDIEPSSLGQSTHRTTFSPILAILSRIDPSSFSHNGGSFGFAGLRNSTTVYNICLSPNTILNNSAVNFQWALKPFLPQAASKQSCTSPHHRKSIWCVRSRNPNKSSWLVNKSRKNFTPLTKA